MLLLMLHVPCRHGYTAGELFAQLAAEEFEQQGGMVAVALPIHAGAASVTAEIFGRCCSSWFPGCTKSS